MDDTCNIRYTIQQKEHYNSPPVLPNEFAILMLSAKELCLSSKLLTAERYESGRGDHCLYDDVISFMESKNPGFGAVYNWQAGGESFDRCLVLFSASS